MSDILNSLNTKQIEAVEETEGYVRVVAGAGSGKTKLLVSRYAYLVKEYGIDSSNILCVTFTNKAAGEMKRRIRELIGDAYDTTLICTYHGFCNRLLREDSAKIFMDKQFQIIDTFQQRAILGEIYQKYELKFDYAAFDSIMKKIAIYKSCDKSYIERSVNPAPGQIMKNIDDQTSQIIEDYLQKQKATYSLDFQDLILYAIYVLEEYEDVRQKWQDRLNYIMVDEFQDSSKTEMKLIDILSAKYRNLMIVGDPDQNIYEWRGSDVKLLVDFDKAHVGTKTMILDQNYRSTPNILKCSNDLISHNKFRIEKSLFTLDNEQIPVVHYHSNSDAQETELITRSIKTLMAREGMKYSDFAILYRSGFLSRVIEKKLVEKNVPYEIFGGVKFYQRMEVQDVLAYLKLIAYGDDHSFKRIANVPRRRFGRTKMSLLEKLREDSDGMYQQDLFEMAEEERVANTLYDTLKRNMSNDMLLNSDIGGLVNIVEDMRRRKATMRIPEIVNEVMNSSGYEQYIRGFGDEERLENLSEFKRIANEFEQDFGEDLTLEQFLDQVLLQSSEDSSEEGDKVKLMTIHASKGLEFPVVLLVGMSEGIFPSSKTIEERKENGLEEERRLCYVAMTRARRYLFLMDSEGQSEQGMKKLYSRFLDEIGEQNYKRIGKMSEEYRRESMAYRRKLDQKMTPVIEPVSLTVGGSVEHHIFGRGKIINYDDKRMSYLIQFDGMDKPRNISAEYFTTDHSRRTVPSPNMTPEKADDHEAVVNVEIDYDEYDEDEGSEEIAEIEEVIEAVTYDESVDLVELKRKTPNLLNDPSVPKEGWYCGGVSDLGAPAAVCQLCGRQIIRYVHHMHNPYYKSLDCGCVCAGKLEGNIQTARQRESELKNRKKRKTTDSARPTGWKISRKGYVYRIINDHTLVLFKRKDKWMYSIDRNVNSFQYESLEEAAKYAEKAASL